MGQFSPIGVEAIVKGLDKYLSDIGRMDKANLGAGGGLNGLAAGAAGLASGLATIAFAAAAAGATALAAGLSYAVKEASDSEQVFARLGAAITASGGMGPAMKDLAGWVDAGGGYMKKMDADGSFSYKLKTAGVEANYTLEQAKALSMSLRDLAGGSDEAVAGIIEMGVRMGTVAGKDMPQFVTSVLDIAAATGTDATTAARNLAQSLDDPVGAMGRFARMGLKVNEATEKTVKDLVKQGKTQEAVAVLTDALAKKSEGAAKTMSKTWKGQMDIMSGHIKEGFENVGLSLLPMLEKANVLFMPFIDNIEHTGALIGAWVTGVLSLAQIVGIGEVLSRIFGPQIGGQIAGIVDTLMKIGTDVWTTIQPFLDAFGTFVSDLVTAQAPTFLAGIQQFLDGFSTFWSTSGPGIMVFASTLGQIAAITGVSALTFLSGLAGAVGALLANDAGGFLERLGAAFVTLAENMSGMDLGPGLAAWAGVWDNFKIIVTTAWTQTVTALQTIGSNLVQGLIDGINGAVGRLKKTVDGVFGQLPAWVKAIFGTHSPSTVFMKIGANLTQGLAEGIASPNLMQRAMGSVLAPTVAAPAFAMAGAVDNRSINLNGPMNMGSRMNMQSFDQMMRGWLNQ